ncbi:hypothetical protein EC973_004386 [Apophysomyces ossiformis]|uniref:Rho-GAP domain-containing protein n=1 Tax=Apophysomyces ossiformis TaxID=679940 RepID=A0A8H7BZP3_9FUNG|nr:hypothetical protein EC973_004386 [Apophysomyces ossiformis]
MSNLLAEIRRLVTVASNHGYTEDGDSHGWVKEYNKYTCTYCNNAKTRSKWWLTVEKSKRGANLSRAKTLPSRQPSAIPYVLPIQRQDTMALINLRRAGSVLTRKMKELTLTGAKKHWVNARLKDQEDKFVSWSNANVFVGTWNVHGSLPDGSLSKWILGTLRTEDGKLFEPDFFVIGLQEMETDTGAYIRYDPAKETAWVNGIIAALGDKANDYYKIASKQLVTMLLIVIGKTCHKAHISEVSTCYAGVGLMNMMGNKGGIGARFRFRDSYLCFITSHLAAFQDKVEKRNQDFAEISKRLVFPHRVDSRLDYVNYSWNDGGDEGVSFLENNEVIRDWTREASIFHADHLVWLGDLNYRINLPEPEIKTRLRQGQLDLLLEYDQLSIEREAGRTFTMFEEGAINFQPTYKFDAGTNNYDTSEKRRAPSWTDRILWKKESFNLYDTMDDDDKKPPPKLNLLAYGNCVDMMLSDHKPVRALMQLKIRTIDTRKQEATKKTLVQQLIETQDNVTKGQISTSFIDFGEVQFMEYKEKKLVIENTGQVVAPFRFIPKMDEQQICPPWLNIHPTSGVLGPGEKTMIQFDLMIDPSISAPFNEGEQKIDDILVLRLENGKDFFIVVSGKYTPTCFGVPIPRLSQMTVPVSEIATVKKSHSPSNTEDQAQAQQATLPKELWRLLNFLWNRHMFRIETLFVDHGDRVISDYIRKCLDTGESFDIVIPSGDDSNSKDTKASGEDKLSCADTVTEKEIVAANSMVDVLVAFLECLPEPVIPTNLYLRALEAGGSPEAMNLLMESLPHAHLNVLHYITSFLKDAINYAPTSHKHERKDRIVETFTVLLRPKADFKERNPANAKHKREKFIAQLLKT